jgi:hypothetical protein
VVSAMPVMRVHTYTLRPEDLPELITRRATLISAVRYAYPGLTETRLCRSQDGTFTDAWCWESLELMVAALPATSSPEAAAAMALTANATATTVEVVEEEWE